MPLEKNDAEKLARCRIATERPFVENPVFASQARIFKNVTHWNGVSAEALGVFLISLSVVL